MVNAQFDIKSSTAYALPSMLMLLAILTLVAFSAVTLQYLRRQLAQMEVARVRADYASESGIAAACADVPFTRSGWHGITTKKYSFSDGSEAQVKLDTWGVFLRIHS